MIRWRWGLVADLNRPGGNVTGVMFLANQLGGERLGLLLELVPKATVIAFLMDPRQRASVAEYPEVEAAARSVGRKIVLVKAASEREFEPAFATIVQAGAGALVVGGSPLIHQPKPTTRGAGSAPFDSGDLRCALSRSRRRPDELRDKFTRRLSPGGRLCWANSEGRPTFRIASPAIDHVRAGHQYEDCEGARPHDPPIAVAPRGRNHS